MTARSSGGPRQPANKQPANKQPANKQPAGTRPANRQPAARPARQATSASRQGRRHTAMTVVVLVVLTIFAGRLVYVQGLRGEAVAAEALDERMSTAKLTADRGEITDANGEVLATSVERYTLWVNQVDIAAWKRTSGGKVVSAGAAGAAAELAPLLELDAAALGAQLVGEKSYLVLKRDVLPEVWRAVRELGIAGVNADRVPERVYPAGNVGGNIIGWVDNDGIGQEGLERALNDSLTGTDGSSRWERGLGGQQIPGGKQETTPAVAGEDVQLTILRDLQWKAQDALDKAVADTGADSASLIVTHIPTGEILALADSGAVDPNDPGATEADSRISRALSNVFEPGSTAKVITMAAAIETGVAAPLDQWQVPYQYTTENNQTFKDSHEHDLLNLTTAGVLAESSNTGTVMIGQNIPQQVRYDYLAKFGFGKRTGIELPGESAGILHPADEWDGRTKYAVLFGQGLSVTALQATQAFAIIGGGGVAMTPHIIKGRTGADGVYTPTPIAAGTQVISAETAATVLKMMESAVDEGTGSAAAIPGYRVAGKTGTAQAWATDGSVGITASFIGVAPVDDPQIAVSVIMNNPRSSEWGGTVAAPVFGDVAGYALQMLKVAPSGSAPDVFATTFP
ncbi:peptidoglycan D,D-transpeptidase FtsI family protein [Pengzhenrongella sicca]|uniref:Penicillin-binding protein 2 n=1 Tax=Pengzhenrongella sicca TaxID=2819238 RepID=A0A8A4ZFI1_9MICO|nr:penicillin-binding protein 2 [Pengzhenrongella sicca]QTE30654.1 penicillin-binding protein 2 [Pengzhenrongella sicca]